MEIDTPLKSLGPVEMGDLQALILAQEDAAWGENNYRQKEYDVHTDTESIVLVFCDDEWPEISVMKEVGWDRLSKEAIPVMHGIIGQHYPAGGTIIRAMAARLRPGGKITPHTDNLENFKHAHRIHVPIKTSRRVRFMIEGRPYKFEVGQAYEINNMLVHSVINAGKEDRIHFIFDYLPRPQG